MPNKPPGIMPIAKSTFTISDLYGPDLEIGGWKLPGHGDPYSNCGHLLTLGCLNVAGHNQSNLDGIDTIGRAFIRVKKRTCLRAECPVCYEKWAGKETGRMETRLKAWKLGGRVIHYVISPPGGLYHLPIQDYYVKGYSKRKGAFIDRKRPGLRSLAYKIARKTGLFGGSCIVHPFREACKVCGSPKDTETKRCLSCGAMEFLWYFSPHFHFLGYGWIKGDKVKAVYEKSGWICKNAGIRDSVGATALYQLSHCGVHKRYHSVTWMGALSYNRLRVLLAQEKKPTCPLCGNDLVKVLYIGEGHKPDLEGDYYLKPDEWTEGGFGSWMNM